MEIWVITAMEAVLPQSPDNLGGEYKSCCDYISYDGCISSSVCRTLMCIKDVPPN